MTAATANAPFPAIRTDSVWAHDIVFEGESLADAVLALTLVSVGRPITTRRFDLGEGLTVVGTDRVTVRLTVAQVEGLTPGDYGLQVQRGEGDQAETLLIGTVPVEKGLEAYLKPGSGPLQTAVSKASAVPVVTVPAGTTRVVRGGAMSGPAGPPGPPGPNDAALILLPPDLSEVLGGSANLAEALLWLAENGGGPLPPSPFWSAHRGLIGAI